ncbi:MAG: hypothetical protein IJ411_02305, partial [Oscillospiraceae bacterium]|nr:hypothetical protein [Oscillospiraceae bacterium]
MKIKISDMMDHVEPIPLELREQESASIERIKEVTMSKIQNTAKNKPQTVRKISRAGLVALAAAMTLCLTVVAAVVVQWNGFAFTEGLSFAEKNALMEEGSTAYAGAMIEADGTTHYYDKNGKEFLVLSAEEAAEYEREQQVEHDRKVIESTQLVDLSTMPLLPGKVTEVEAEEDGSFADFMLGNGSLVLLSPSEEQGYELKSGDSVTISLHSNDQCRLEFGCFKDGAYLEAETSSAEEHSYTFTIEEDGLYCFYLEYYSAGVSSFTKGS